MGWDAITNVYNYETKKYTNRNFSKAFRQAAAAVTLLTGSVDGDLCHGGLDCSLCRKFLEKATGLVCYIDWDAAETVKIEASANWDFYYKPDEAWAYFSAKLFLEICAHHKLAVTFTF